MTVDGKTALTALKRFGLGPRFGEVARIAPDPRGFVLAQLDRREAVAIEERLPATAEAWRLQKEFLAGRKRAIEASAKGGQVDASVRQPAMMMDSQEPPRTYATEVLARVRHALTTEAPYLERLVGFWTDHFCVSAKKNGVTRSIAGAYEREAIRPHVLGRFRDMLQAVVHHPAMLFYLDNHRSYGPNSPRGRRRGEGLNENLAREILELHTLGVDGGYSQQDVTDLARALTGWSVHGPKSAEVGQFVFLDQAHEPGGVTILGRAYDQSGMAQAEAVLDDLAAQPATARHVARKLAVHFVADDAPQALVEQLAGTFRESDGDLKAVAAALASSEEAWAGEPVKLLPPYDLMVAVYRAIGLDPEEGFVLKTLRTFGQPLWSVDSPAGWPQGDDAWAAPDAMLERVDWASRVAEKAVASVDDNLVEAARDLLGESLSEPTREAIERAESRQQALVLLFLSPEFQRR